MAKGDDRDRERFIKLAFCRADLLVELDEALRIDFVAGATPVLLGAKPEELSGRVFSTLLAENDRARITKLLLTLPPTGRMEETVVSLQGVGGRSLRTMMAGYRATDFADHVFLVFKVSVAVVPKTGEADPPPLRGKGDFEKAAATRIEECQKAGKIPQLSLLQLNNFDGLMTSLGASAKREFLNAVTGMLSHASLGEDSAGDLGGGRFSVLHDENVSIDDIGFAIETETRRLGPAGEAVTVASATLDADGAGMSEEQTAKALAYTVREFCSKGTKGVHKNLTQAITMMMNKTVGTVAILRKIISKSELDLVFMPICDLRLGKVHHFEALARFRHPDYQASPYPLVVLAEEVDIITDLDMLIVNKALASLKSFESRGPLPPMAVNLSGKSINTPAFVEDLLRLLATCGVPPAKLMFEITESARVDNLTNVNNVIQRFRGKGYKFALDDFGAGSASFDYLNALDADYVKFDGPVIRRACGTPKGNDLLSTMSKMCSHNKIMTVAEMVEDKAMANQIYYCGIDYGQGWFFGKADKDPYKFSKDFIGAE